MKEPMYQQVYHSLLKQIQAQRLQSKLPSRRQLAKQWGVSLTTIDAAYELLVEAGYVKNSPRSGYYIQAKPILYQQPELKIKSEINLASGQIDTDLFPFKTWARCYRHALNTRPDLLHRGPMEGESELRNQLASHLATYRQVHCEPDQIIVGAGTELLLGNLVQVVKPDLVALEKPAYPRIQSVLTNHGVALSHIELDEQGLICDQLSQEQWVYVTPNLQFPTGVVMSLKRKQALIQTGKLIIEDDYDAPYRQRMRPAMSIQGLCPERTVYLTTFSKSLAPGFRLACMVLPKKLLSQYRQHFQYYANTVSRFDQITLAQFIEKGHFIRHVHRLSNAYTKKQRAVKALFEQYQLHLRFPQAGLFAFLEVSQSLKSELIDHHFKVQWLSDFGGDENTMVIGFGQTSLESLEKLAVFLDHHLHGV